MNSLLHKLVLGSSATALLAIVPFASAFAQDSGSNDIEQVVVSASRISIAGYSAPTPVTVVGAAQLEQDGYANIQDEVSKLPSVTSPPSNLSTIAGGLSPAQGANFLNLRNLGNYRTLVLLDGQRVVVSALQQGAVDVTTFPTALIQRVDIVTGGASATWGSDAVAGVVNFVLNKNFDGFKATIEGSDTSNGLRRGLNGNAAWGSDVFGGRGHVEFSAQANILPDEVLLTQENWYRNSYWVSNPAYAAGNGRPQLIVGNNVGLTTETPGGIINSSAAGTTAAANALRGIEFSGAGVPQIVNYGNVTLGSLSNGGSLSTIDGPWNFQQIASPADTYAFFGYGRYKLTDNIQASLQLDYSYYTGKGIGGAPSQASITIRSDNAYIPSSVSAAMQAGGITSFVLGTLGLNNTNINNLTGANLFGQAEGSFGPIIIDIRRSLDRGVFTLEGSLGDDWSWNTYIQHSEVQNSIHTPNDPIVANLVNAEDAVTVTSANVGKSGLALGSVACRSTLTGAAVVSGNITAQPGCIPLNVFGTGVASPAALAYATGAGTPDAAFVHAKFQQEVAEGSMQGTLPWALPAGKVAVAFGAGYRKEAIVEYAPPNPFGLAGTYSQGNITNFPSKSYNVIEGFAEADAPILKDNIVNSLDFTMAGRMTSYSTSGLVETWKLGATSQVIDDVKLRTSWSVDIRAPQLFELYNPGSAAQQSARDPKSQNTVNILTATTGNTNLVPEIARTISGGAVLTPTFLPGLTLSADWYNINVTGEITTLSQATILAQCNPTLPSLITPGTNGNPNDPLCKFLTFNGPGGSLSQINLQTINIASDRTSGLDLQANYSMDFWEGTLALASTDNYTDENTVFNPGSGVNDIAGSFGPGGAGTIAGPKWRGVLSATYDTGPYSFTVQSRWFGTFIVQNNGNTGALASAATANLYDPAHFEVPATAYLDLRGNYKWNDNITFYGAIDNTLDTPPPLVPNYSSNNNTGSAILGTAGPFYDLLGRTIRLGIRVNY